MIPGFFTQQVIEQDRAVVPDNRQYSEFSHVSGLVNHCPRMLSLLRIAPLNSLQRASGADRIVWAMGRAAEAHVRKQFIARTNAAGVIGRWHCGCRRTGSVGLRPLEWETPCPYCAGKTDHYGELTLKCPETGLAGNPDFLFLTPEQRLVVVEIKSINRTEFSALEAAKADHITQASCYHWLASSTVAVSPSVMWPEVVVIYVCKDYHFTQSPYKEFHVPVADWEPQVALVLEHARQVKRFRETGALPERLRACTSPDDSQARNCPTCIACFLR